jgi:hypothetical protein
MLLPEPAENHVVGGHWEVREEVGEMRTFAMDPQERTRRPPFLKGVTLYKPRCGSVVVLVECNVVIC